MTTLKNRMGMGMGVIALTATSTMGCVTGEAEPAESVSREPIAMLGLDNGARVAFYEPLRGELLVFVQGEVPGDTAHLKPVEIYERLAGGSAPAVLQAAQQRADRALAARPPRGPATTDVVAAPERGASSLTASGFRSEFCSMNGVDFDYCWTDRTANYSIDITSVDWIHAHANVISGSTDLSMYRRNWLGGYDLLFSDTVTGSATVITQSATNDDIFTDTYRVTMSHAADDTYHLSIHGDK